MTVTRANYLTLLDELGRIRGILSQWDMGQISDKKAITEVQAVLSAPSPTQEREVSDGS